MSKGRAKKTDRQVQEIVRAELRRSVLLMAIHQGGNVLNTVVKYGCLVLIVWVIADGCVKVAPSVAGKDTDVSVLVAVAIKAASAHWIQWAIYGVFLFAFLIQRSNYQKRIARLADQKKQVEMAVDPKRSGSGMRPDGKLPDE